MTPLLFLLAAGPAAPPAVALPAEVRVRPGRIVPLKADTAGAVVKWAMASDAADLIPLPPAGKDALFCSPTPGRYVVFAWTAGGDEPSDAARCVVIVAGEPPAPPAPAPPADPFAADLRSLFAADPAADKAAHLAQLAAVYREAVAFAATADVRTAGDLAGRIRTAVGSLLPADALAGVRKRVAGEIAGHLPDSADRPLDTPTRQAAALLFARIATTLEALR